MTSYRIIKCRTWDMMIIATNAVKEAVVSSIMITIRNLLYSFVSSTFKRELFSTVKFSRQNTIIIRSTHAET